MNMELESVYAFEFLRLFLWLKKKGILMDLGMAKNFFKTIKQKSIFSKYFTHITQAVLNLFEKGRKVGEGVI